MNENLRKKIIADIETTGFGSEMRAAKIYLEQKWFGASKGDYFDKDENKTREINIEAYKPLTTSNDTKKNEISVFFHSICEVKKSKYPWIVFKDNSLRHFQPSDAWNNLIFKDNLPKLPKNFMKELEKYSLLSKKKWLGNSIHEVFKKPDVNSKWYSALLSAIKASEHILSEES